MGAIDITTLALPRYGFLVSKKRLWLYISIAVYVALSWYSYANYISPENGVDLLFYVPHTGKTIEALVLLFLSAALLPTETNKVSDFILILFFVLPYTGHVLLYALLDASRVYCYESVAVFMFLAVARNFSFSLPTPAISVSGLNVSVALCIVGVIVAAALYAAIVGIHDFNLNPMKVYDFRAEVTEAAGESHALGYIGNWGYKIFTPFLFAIVLWKKKWLLIPVLCIIQIYFYGISSAKVALALPMLVLLAYAVGRRGFNGLYIVAAGTAVILVGVLEEVFLHSSLFNLLVVRREIWIPARLNWLYYDLFTQFGLVHWGNTFLSSIIHYNLPTDPQNFVDLYQFGWDGNAGTGFLGSGFMQAGVYGMFGYAVILAFLMAVVDRLTEDALPQWLGLAMVIVPFYFALSSADLSAALATHGLFVAIGLLYLSSLPKKQTYALQT